MHTDPIADLLTRIRNATKAHHESTTMPHSKIKEEIAKLLKARKFIDDYRVEGEGITKAIVIDLNEERSDIYLRRISKPGQRIYVKSENLKPVRSGLGISIISTSKGLMTNSEAKKQHIGGELICEIY